MARYVEKDEAALAWGRIRRAVMAKAHVEAANWREEQLNRILPELQTQFDAALHQGEILELGPGDWSEMFPEGADA